MKRFLLLALWTALTIFFATPAVLGIADIWCYAVLGRAVTGVAWGPDPVMLAALFLAPAFGCAVVTGLIAEEARG